MTNIVFKRAEELRKDLKKDNKKYTQEWLAKEADLPLDTYKHLKTPNGETVLKLAKALGVSTDYLLGKTDHLHVAIRFGERYSHANSRSIGSQWCRHARRTAYVRRRDCNELQ